MDKAAVYRIRVQGVIPDDWIDRLGGLQITVINSQVVTLEGWLPDQAALAGVLDTLSMDCGTPTGGYLSDGIHQQRVQERITTEEAVG